MNCLTPISTPLVGQSRIRISESLAIHLARETFCLFPPDRVETSCSGELHLICSSLTCLLTSFFSSFLKTKKLSLAMLLIEAMAMLSKMDVFRARASTSRFLER